MIGTARAMEQSGGIVNSGLYVACSGLIAKTQALEVAANNLANVSTVAYKSQEPVFRMTLAKATEPGRQASVPAKLTPAVNGFAFVGATRTNLQSGGIEQTQSELDCAIEGEAFFAVQSKAGVRYTRDGRFGLSADRHLINHEGDLVLGEDGPIQLAPGALSISGDGTMSVDGALVGKLKLVEFPTGTPLTAEGRNYFQAEGGAVAAATRSRVLQGALEQSNVSPTSGAVGLIELQRHADLLQRTLSIFHSEFNRSSAEDLARV